MAKPMTGRARSLAWLVAALVPGAAAAQAPAGTPPGPPAPAGAAHPAALQVIRVDPQAGVDCPSATEVTTAINDRLPGAIGPAAPAPEDEGRTARLLLTQVSPGAIRVELIAASGASVLERTLEVLGPAPPGRRSETPHERAACLALADTISLIVQRYFKHLEYHDDAATTAPPPRPPPPAPPAAPAPAPVLIAAPPPPSGKGPRTVLVGAIADLAGPVSQPWGDSVWTPSGGLAVALAWARWTLIAQGAVGASVKTPAILDTAGGTFSYRPVPLRIAAGLRLPFANSTLTPTVGAGADLLFESAHGLRNGGTSLTTEPVLEAGARYTLRLGGSTFVEPHVFGVLNLQPHDFQVAGLTQPVLRTGRFYARAGLSFGIAHDLGGASATP